MTHRQWWIKRGGSVGSCDYVDSRRSWHAAQRYGKIKLKAKIARLKIKLHQTVDWNEAIDKVVASI